MKINAHLMGAAGPSSRSRVTSLVRGLLPSVACCLCIRSVMANPAGGTVSQGQATFSVQGSHLTIQTSDRAFINWRSFNIGLGETTTFVQPSSTSLVWNYITDPNP